MAQVETKLGRVQAVAGEGVVDSSVKAQQLQAGLSQLSTSLANFGKASEKRRIQNDIITARTAFALNQEMPGSLAPEAEIAFNDMVAVKSTNQFLRLLSDDAEVFGNQVLIDDEVYPDHKELKMVETKKHVPLISEQVPNVIICFRKQSFSPKRLTVVPI